MKPLQGPAKALAAGNGTLLPRRTAERVPVTTTPATGCS